jgi:hypothetical protein
VAAAAVVAKAAAARTADLQGPARAARGLDQETPGNPPGVFPFTA